MKTSSSSEKSKLDRKMVEKNRRMQMKSLCLKLSSLIPANHSRATRLDFAVTYITQLKENIEKLKIRKEQAMELENGSNTMDTTMFGSRLPVFDLKDLGSSIEVIVISGLQKSFMVYEIISILEEEGAEVVSASFSTVGDKVFHTVHAQVKISRVGVETTRVCQRLQELIN
ncbi:transcription factor bhlh162 [Quercus suber]|uniref:Transcription factor bhlh162 n=1 Tax=Quercus suber TaxID=58331 RepID=A0AAW0LDC3_QUESU